MQRNRKDWALTPGQREDARRALEMLESSGLRLEDAARIAAGQRSVIRPCKFVDGVRIFLRDRAATGLRQSSLEFYEHHLFAAEETFGDALISDLTPERLRNYLLALPAASGARWRALRAMIRFGLRQDPPWLATDPTPSVSVPGPRSTPEPGILPAEAADSAMEAKSPWRPVWALWLFAGLRPSEVRGRGKEAMRWRHIDPDARLVRVPAGAAKTGRARILEGLPDRLWREIGTPGQPDQPIASAGYLSGIRALQTALGYLSDQGRTRVKPWPHDATRHSFATYHLALTGDPGRTSLLLGHEGSPTLLYRHYRGLATEAEAQRWFGLG